MAISCAYRKAIDELVAQHAVYTEWADAFRLLPHSDLHIVAYRHSRPDDYEHMPSALRECIDRALENAPDVVHHNTPAKAFVSRGPRHADILFPILCDEVDRQGIGGRIVFSLRNHLGPGMTDLLEIKRDRQTFAGLRTSYASGKIPGVLLQPLRTPIHVGENELSPVVYEPMP